MKGVIGVMNNFDKDITKLEKELDKKSKRLATLYAKNIINKNYGKGDNGHKVPCVEMIKWVTCKLNAIKEDIECYVKGKVRYPKSYNVNCSSHRMQYKAAVPEKEIARAMINWQRKFRKSIPLREESTTNSIGELRNYEVPFFVGKNNHVVGERIDIISVTDDKRELYILELKNNQSPETILRCLLEAFTYSLFADRVRLKEAYGASQNAKIVICPLIFKGTTPFEQLKQLNGKPEFAKLLREMERVGDVKVKFAVLDANDWGDEKKYTTEFPSDCDGKEFKPEWLWGVKK